MSKNTNCFKQRLSGGPWDNRSVYAPAYTLIISVKGWKGQYVNSVWEVV